MYIPEMAVLSTVKFLYSIQSTKVFSFKRTMPIKEKFASDFIFGEDGLSLKERHLHCESKVQMKDQCHPLGKQVDLSSWYKWGWRLKIIIRSEISVANIRFSGVQFVCV